MTSSVAAILQSGNLFTFVMNNPVGFIDPSGLRAVAINPLIGGVVTSGERQPHPMSAAASRAATGGSSTSTIGITNNHSSVSWTFSGNSVYKDISAVNAPVPLGATWDICWGSTYVSPNMHSIDLTSLVLPTLDVAVQVWSVAHHPFTQNVEFAALILRNRDTGQYSFTRSNVGGFVGGGYAVDFPVNYFIQGDYGRRVEMAAAIHTHPSASTRPGAENLDFFSYRDAYFASIFMGPLYLVAPSGRIDRLTMPWGFTIPHGRDFNTIRPGHNHWPRVTRDVFSR